MKYLAFDLEIARAFDPQTPWQTQRPLGITCAAVAWEDDQGRIMTSIAHGAGADGRPSPQMSVAECQFMVHTLQAAVAEGFTLVTWNGAGFDFGVLAEEAQMPDAVAELAMHHIDMMFYVVCHRGHRLSLAAAAEGMGLAGKTEGVHGAQVPAMWANGQFDDVLDYVAQDARTTFEVAREVDRVKALWWVARSGARRTLPVPKWLTVFEAYQVPVRGPMAGVDPRTQQIGWILPSQAEGGMDGQHGARGNGDTGRHQNHFGRPQATHEKPGGPATQGD